MNPMLRRRLLPLSAALAVVLVNPLSLPVLADELAEGTQRPNIVLIMADDLGFSDLGCYGGEIETPNVDRLAAGGMRFTQFYNCGRCCPTRASLLTGLYAHQAGVGGMEEDRGLPGYRGFLNRRSITIAEGLAAAGYRSYLAGKWNVGHVPGQWPVDRGFARHFGLLRGAADYFDPRVGPRRNASLFALDGEPFTEFPADFYATDAYTDYAVQYVEEHRKSSPADPFFLYVAYTAPHSPLQAPPAEIARYRGRYRAGWDELAGKRRARQKELGLWPGDVPETAADPQVPAWSDAKDQGALELKMAVYAAQVDRMDQGIGRLVETLRRTGVLENTLILFLSDNGADGAPEGAVGPEPGPKGSSHIYGRPWAHLSNTPLAGYKREMNEGGISTPLIAVWLGVIEPGRIAADPGHVIDLLPTCLAVAGAEYPRAFAGEKLQPVEGKSLVPLFRGGTRTPHDVLAWEHDGRRAVRRGDWKLVADRGKAWRLYNLADDRGEAHDRAAEEPAKVAELQAAYEAWATRVGVAPNK
jgi:arylsulfatase A-like enzyme